MSRQSLTAARMQLRHNVGQDGNLRPVDNRPLDLCDTRPGRLTTGRRMPSCPTFMVLAAATVALAADPPPRTLEQRLNALIEKSPVAARSLFGLHVVDLKTGKTLYARNENRLFLPASNMKLATTAL